MVSVHTDLVLLLLRFKTNTDVNFDPGGLLFLAIIGGAEVRKVMKKMLMSSLTK